MARPRSQSREDLVSSAMRVFWDKGFAATSIDDVVNATGVGRGAIYSDFGGKEALFLSCLELYKTRFVAPAIAILNSSADGFSSIEGYFDHFIGLHSKHGMPGPGCFYANVMTELAPHHADIFSAVNDHNINLHNGFLTAISKAAMLSKPDIEQSELENIAAFLTTSSQGLWSYGRSTNDISELERFKTVLLALLRCRFVSI